MSQNQTLNIKPFSKKFNSKNIYCFFLFAMMHDATQRKKPRVSIMLNNARETIFVIITFVDNEVL